MSSSIFEIGQYQLTDSDAFLIDTNIWYYVYGPQQSPGRQSTILYSRALKRMLQARCRIFIDVLVLSEFANRVSRFWYNLQKPTGIKDFKAYRRSPAYKPVAAEVKITVGRILTMCHRLASEFEKLSDADVESLLTLFESGNNDINDLLLAKTCNVRGLKILTHNEDFRDLGVTIVTGNKNLLMRNP